MGCVLFALICLVVFVWALLELGPNIALFLAVFFGLDDSALPVGFLIAGVFIAVCIYKGVREGLK